MSVTVCEGEEGRACGECAYMKEACAPELSVFIGS